MRRPRAHEPFARRGRRAVLWVAFAACRPRRFVAPGLGAALIGWRRWRREALGARRQGGVALFAKFSARSPRCFGFHLADGVFQREPLLGDLGLRQRGFDGSAASPARCARAHKRPARFTGVFLESLNGANDEWKIVGHRQSLRPLGGFFISIYISNGFCIKIVSSRSGLVESMAAGQPVSSSSRRTYFDRLGGQIATRARPGRLFPPAGNSLVDRFDLGLRVLSGRQVIDLAPVQAIRGADLDFVKAVEDVELGEREAVDATGADGLADQYGVEPAAAARPAGDNPELLAALAERPADLVFLFGRERAFADRDSQPGLLGNESV